MALVQTPLWGTNFPEANTVCSSHNLLWRAAAGSSGQQRHLHRSSSGEISPADTRRTSLEELPTTTTTTTTTTAKPPEETPVFCSTNSQDNFSPCHVVSDIDPDDTLALDEEKRTSEDVVRDFSEADGRNSTDRTAARPSYIYGTAAEGKSFRKWINSLHRRATSRSIAVLTANDEAWCSISSQWNFPSTPAVMPHSRRSSCDSSSFSELVSTVKTAGSSMANISLLTMSTHNMSRQTIHTHRSTLSIQGPKPADEGSCQASSVVNNEASKRAIQRRQILEELISTEENYVGDVKFLTIAYSTILASVPTVRPGFRSSVTRNLNDIVKLHQDILNELHKLVPFSEQCSLDDPTSSSDGFSANLTTSAKADSSWPSTTPVVKTEPHVVAAVASLFEEKICQCFVYQEYGAKYDMIMKDIALAQEVIPDWEAYQRGLEIWALSVTSTSSTSTMGTSKRSLTISDLLMKPIQRICRYPLLFSELLKSTPECDSPDANITIQTALARLREATTGINHATDDSGVKAKLARTWLLHDRLVFPSQRTDAPSKAQIHSLGHVLLCGTLHVCWQTQTEVSGQYMISLLYPEYLCLATANSTGQIYTIQACIQRRVIQVEDAYSSTGLQCHSAQYSWKILFECNYQWFELLMTACSAKEELEWRTRLPEPTSMFAKTVCSSPNALTTFLNLNARTIGTPMEKSDTMINGTAIQRAASVGSQSHFCQVILKGTNLSKESAALTNISRSQSLLLTNGKVATLAPARTERTRLEGLLYDVWSKDVLPYPGAGGRVRSEHSVRSSASSMIRKLSVASIASTFSKRSCSGASIKATSTATIIAKTDNDSDSSRGECKPDRNERHVSPTLQPSELPNSSSASTSTLICRVRLRGRSTSVIEMVPKLTCDVEKRPQNGLTLAESPVAANKRASSISSARTVADFTTNGQHDVSSDRSSDDDAIYLRTAERTPTPVSLEDRHIKLTRSPSRVAKAWIKRRRTLSARKQSHSLGSIFR